MHYIARKSFKKYRQLDPRCRNLVRDLYKIREERTILGGRGGVSLFSPVLCKLFT